MTTYLLTIDTSCASCGYNDLTELFHDLTPEQVSVLERLGELQVFKNGRICDAVREEKLTPRTNEETGEVRYYIRSVMKAVGLMDYFLLPQPKLPEWNGTTISRAAADDMITRALELGAYLTEDSEVKFEMKPRSYKDEAVAEMLRNYLEGSVTTEEEGE